jgi:hypothetical protein
LQKLSEAEEEEYIHGAWGGSDPGDRTRVRGQTTASDSSSPEIYRTPKKRRPPSPPTPPDRPPFPLPWQTTRPLPTLPPPMAATDTLPPPTAATDTDAPATESPDPGSTGTKKKRRSKSQEERWTRSRAAKQGQILPDLWDQPFDKQRPKRKK